MNYSLADRIVNVNNPIHTQAVNSPLVAFVADSLNKIYNYFDDTGMKLLAIHPSQHFSNPRYINSYAENDLDALLDMDIKYL